MNQLLCSGTHCRRPGPYSMRWIVSPNYPHSSTSVMYSTISGSSWRRRAYSTTGPGHKANLRGTT